MSTQNTLNIIYNTYAKKYGKAQAKRWIAQQKTRNTKSLPALTTADRLLSPNQNSETLKRPPSRFKQKFRDNPIAKLRQRPSQTPINHQNKDLSYNWVNLDSEALTKQLTANLEDKLSKSQLKTFRLLHSSALSIAEKRGYAPSVTQVSFFCPAEVVSFARGIHRTTLWRQLKPMLELGLLDYRAHKTTHEGKTVTDGTIWSIKLHPGRGKAPRLSYQDLKAKYRDLAADIDAGRTAHNLIKNKMQQSYTQEEYIHRKKLIIDWALTPISYLTPVSNDCCKMPAIALESVLDVAHTAKKDRNKSVDMAAQAISSALGDSTSHRFYAKLLWNLLRRHDQGQDYFHKIYYMIVRARADYNEGFARSAGALFVSRLKKTAIWDWLEQTPMVRVGAVPNHALCQ